MYFEKGRFVFSGFCFFSGLMSVYYECVELYP